MCDSSAEKIFEAQKSSSFGIFQSILTETDLWINRLHKIGIFTLLRFLNEYNLRPVLILNREITNDEPGDSNKKDSYKKNGVFGRLREPVFFLRWLNFFSLTKNIPANFWIWIRFFELAKYSISKWFDLLILEYAAFKKIMKIYVPYMVHRHKFRWMKAKWSPIKRAIFDDTIIQSLSAHFQLS